MSNELQHFGVKGMKWGVRKSPDQVAAIRAKKQEAKDLKRADKIWARDAKKNKQASIDKAVVSKEGSAAVAKALDSLIKAGVRGPALNNAFQQSVAGIIDRAWAADKSMYNPSGTKRMTMLEYRDDYGNSYLAPRIMPVDIKYIDDIKHSDPDADDEDSDDSDVSISEVFKAGFSGSTVGPIESVDDVVATDTGEFIKHDCDVENVLSHYGVLGMKWGIRRSVGPDGAVSSRPKAPRTPSDRQIKSARRKDVRNRRKMSDRDLMEKIGRLEKEKKLRELTDSEINSGKKAMSDVLKNAGTKTLTTVAAGAALYGVKYILTGKADPADLAGYVAPKPGKK